MKLNKYLIVLILLNLFLISLSANEKLIIENDNTEEILNNEIAPQFCFSLKINKFIKSNKNSLMTRDDYLRRAGGFLAMGITGVIFTSLSIPVSVTLTVLFWYIAPGFAYNLFILLPILFFLPFVAIGLPLLFIGFYYYSFYKKQNKIPNPFTNVNNYNEIVLFKFNLIKQGA